MNFELQIDTVPSHNGLAPLASNIFDGDKEEFFERILGGKSPFSLLDMLTNGGRGCALWWPFSLERIFFPWRPIQVSPMSVSDFISPWGLEVLASEVIWIGFPCMSLIWVARMIRR
ncbi:MAG: hypothetical protein Q7T20_05645 [Saprospiraceae bacterium]|nr:hypothetical protein [Saprospiraceae bacterium]